MHDCQPIRRKIDSRIATFGGLAIGCRHISPHATTVRAPHDSTSEFPNSGYVYMGVSWWFDYRKLNDASGASGVARNIEDEYLLQQLFCSTMAVPTTALDKVSLIFRVTDKYLLDGYPWT